jgi:hypothetical protein
VKSYKDCFSNKNFIIAFFSSVLFFILSIIIQVFVSGYTDRAAGGAVSDIFLSNTRVYEVGWIFVWGSIILALFLLFLCLYDLRSFPFVFKSIAFFTVVRAIFVSLTHISVFPNHLIINSSLSGYLLFSGIFTGNDLFFSGHTGLPFLLALIFWKDKVLRIIFLSSSLIFAAVVLLGHIHYSIDVLSAFFITYTVYVIACKLFKKDKAFFETTEPIVSL